ncbi:NUDIX hydrolase [Kitasatospora sp. NPDC090308]|uniref:NUDIX hydrolase n=1 Tax=Kitasatospora sp. NPDC090308 TaxID=3364082 RepID=UPI00380CC7F4
MDTPATGPATDSDAGPFTGPATHPDEILDVVDEQDRVLRTAPRSEVYRDGLIHRCVFVLVRDPRGRIFTHRRTDTKAFAPGAHDCFVGGVVGAGESYPEAAVREAEEELGVTGIRTRPLFRFLYTDGDRYSWWSDVHEAEWDGPVHPQESEVAWYDWLTEEQLAERLTGWEFVPDGREAYRRYLERRATA